MFVAKNCRKNGEWHNMEDDVMIALQKVKFEDPARRKALTDTIGQHLYEATLDRRYGCGFHLGQCEEITIENIQFGNRLGEILEDLRTTFTGEPPLPKKDEARRARKQREEDNAKAENQAIDQPDPAAAPATPGQG